jgi:hypothetical protein
MTLTFVLKAVCETENCSETASDIYYTTSWWIFPASSEIKYGHDKKSQNRNSNAAFRTIFKIIKCFHRGYENLYFYLFFSSRRYHKNVKVITVSLSAIREFVFTY